MMPKKTAFNTPVLDAALEYLDRGFSIIPVKKDKTPLLKWKEFQSRLPSYDEVCGWWAKWPDANVAIVCGKISGIFCVDADGPEGIEWMKIYLPYTSVYGITAKGLHGIYRIPENAVIGNKVRLAPEVDIRGEGGYFVAEPSVHESGHVYRFQIDMGGWDDLPEYKPPQSTQAKASPGPGNLNLDLSAAKTSPINEPVPKGSRNHTLTQLVGKWVSMGLEPEEVRALADSWNNKNLVPIGSDPREKHEIQKTIDSIVKTHQKNHPTHEPVQISEAPVFTPYIEKETNIPESVLSPGGMLSELMEYADDSCAVSHPVFNLAGAIATIGTLVGQKFMTDTGLRTNFYNIVLGYAGAGKDAPQAAFQHLLSQTYAANCIGPNSVTSEPAILKHIQHADKARCLMFLDEIGLLLKGVKAERSAAKEVPAMLMQLFSGINRSFTKPYATQDNLVVKWHHLSLYGASTPQRFWDNFTATEASDGFLPRILVFESRHLREPIKKQVIEEVPQSLIDQVNAIADYTPKTRGGNLENLPVPKRIRCAKKAGELFDEYEREIIIKQNKVQESNEAAAAILGRVCEHSRKLSLVHAVSMDGVKVSQIKLGSVQWAIDLMESISVHTIEQIRDNISENEWHSKHQKLMKIIRKVASKDKPGASMRQLLRRSHLPQKTVDELIKGMLLSGEVIQFTHKPNRGPSSVLYCKGGK